MASTEAVEFGLLDGGQKLVGPAVVISDIHALGLAKAKGLIATTAYYWDRDDESRAWAKRFFERNRRMPGMIQASVYSSVMHYLNVVKAAGTDDGQTVAEKIWLAPARVRRSACKTRLLRELREDPHQPLHPVGVA